MPIRPVQTRTAPRRFISALERFWRLVCLLAVFLAGCAANAVDGAAGAGDPIFPRLGNGGYDVQRYILNLEVEPAHNSVRGLATIDALALARLQRFNLDFEQLNVKSVEVDGVSAGFSHAGGKLTITPAHPLRKGSRFSIRVIYHGSPQPVALVTPSGALSPSGWLRTPGGVVNVMSEPNGAAGWFPLNNHPGDKALFRINVGVPAPWVVAAPGELKEIRAEDDRIHYIWEMDKPMAGYLASINIDRYHVEMVPGPHNILLRHYLPQDLDPRLREPLQTIPEMLAYFETLFGPYPFKQYGLVVAGADLPACQDASGGALESQTLAVFCPNLLGDEAALAHELAHQWFGSSVSLATWQDLWLKEGPATYAEWLWAFRNRSVEEINRYAQTELESYAPEGITGAPQAEDLYGRCTTLGGALVLHALRLQVGDESFFKILREYQDRYKYANAGTQEFMALCEEISGQDLAAFFDAWLFKTPPRRMPG